MEVAVQVFGAAGLVETVVEVAYVVTTLRRFTTFEEWYFLASVSFEVAGELLFLFAGICLLSRNSNRRTTARALTKDPVHHVAAVATDSDYMSWEFAALSLASTVVSLLPLLAWATFLPVWGEPFAEDGGDEGLRVALSAFSLTGVVAMLASGERARRSSPGSKRQRAMDTLVVVGVVSYATQKAFEVCVLASAWERLCTGVLGKALVVLLTVEILSVAFAVVVIFSVVRRDF
ncbi:expressed unknown protein [Ectocarpus siliculosus]|uniref:Uncharacterized protein n=1 Tax=Ectocarpus siliculosus TaxID=2880 RepID=D8LHE9_ECTSI|nr:expressed unknown protein [Ectocarpus siliculosus]|eukprot:CBN80266.1 expressed unknown protein [Ectocarpus siliculosus]